MDPTRWAQVHGAIVHFPLALTFFALFCDGAALTSWSRPGSAVLRASAGYALVAGALGSLPAVVSGLWLTHGVLLGTGDVRRHHLFGWPAFALLIALACWRMVRRETPTRRNHGVFVLLLGGLAGLMAATGHWGAQLALAYP
jgi:uncharacterized membrane protein